MDYEVAPHCYHSTATKIWGCYIVHGVSKLREALLWWDTVKDTNGCTKMTWSKFIELFKEEFCLIKTEMSLFEEHNTLKRGSNQTVKEYTGRFEELWWFVSEYLTPKKRKIYSFVWGLRDDIKKFISPSHMITWEKTILVASAIEDENNKRLEISRCADCGMIHGSRESLYVPNECRCLHGII
ncbi:zinc finger, CCHC-type, retrotransposon gag domain protein [Tanacetum coccineum]